MSEIKKDGREAEALSMDELENVSGGCKKCGLIPWEKWPICSYAHTPRCPGNPQCPRYNTDNCIQGHYNPDVR